MLEKLDVKLSSDEKDLEGKPLLKAVFVLSISLHLASSCSISPAFPPLVQHAKVPPRR